MDGRSLRSARSRRAVVDAALRLAAEGETRPTARMLVERSGVSHSTLFRLYEDLDALHAEVVEAQRERITSMLEAFDPTLPLAERVERLVDNRARIFEVIGPVRHAGARIAASSPRVAEGRRSLEKFLRTQALDLFAPELAADGDDSTRRDLVDALTSWDMWARLTAAQGLSVRRARSAVTRALLDLLR